MFCKSQGALLSSTYLDDDTVIVWKDYENSFTLIGIGREYTEKVVRDFMDLMFNATIFSIGLNEVMLNKNPDKLKRELKVGRIETNVDLFCLISFGAQRIPLE